MADIAQRLRNFCIWNNRQSHYEPVPLCQEAADEIERLRQTPSIQKIEAQARRYAEMYPQSSDGRNTFIIFADWVASQISSNSEHVK